MGSKLRILMMTNTYFPIVGGLEKSVESFTHQFRKMGHEVLIVAPQFGEVKESDNDVIRIPAIQRFNHTDFSVNLPFPGLLSKLALDFKPDIVHAHHPFLVGDLAIRLCGQYQIPLVFTYHTMFDQYTHYLPLHNDFMKYFLLELSVGYSNLADCVFAPSEYVRGFLTAKGVKTRIEVVPSGVDIGLHQSGTGEKIRKEFNIPSNVFVLGYAGRLAPEKNLEFLVSASLRFMKMHPQTHFLMAGKGPSQAQIRELFRNAGMLDRFHDAGVVLGRELVACYKAMDVFVFTSKSETQGMALFEAMASGTPVVALEAPAINEVVKDLYNGRLVPDEDLDSYVESLSWCLKQTSKVWTLLKSHARETARHYSLLRCAANAIAAYRTVKKQKYAAWDTEQAGWREALRRLKTEWDLFANISRASGKSLTETVTHRELRNL